MALVKIRLHVVSVLKQPEGVKVPVYLFQCNKTNLSYLKRFNIKLRYRNLVFELVFELHKETSDNLRFDV